MNKPVVNIYLDAHQIREGFINQSLAQLSQKAARHAVKQVIDWVEEHGDISQGCSDEYLWLGWSDWQALKELVKE